MSMELMKNYSAQIRLIRQFLKSEREVAEGAELLDAREALGELRRKHLG